MEIRQPIFLHCFSRGGSNILWNIFLSHPDVCSPVQETLQIFGAGITHATWEGYLVALLSRQRRLFDQWYLAPRRPVAARAKRLIDHTLHRHKLKTLQDEEMIFKQEGVRYTAQEVEQARLIAKNNNGLAFLSDLFLELYPNTTFFALVRHPVALYESHKRRKITQSIQAFAHFYNCIATRMVEDANRIQRYHIVQYEELLADPITCTQRLYALAGLDFGKLRKLRFKAKPHLQADGQHATSFQQGQHYWFSLDEVHKILDPDVNKHQMERVDATERESILQMTAPICARLGYAEPLHA